ncbi:ribonuclease Z [Flavobacteriaceae bacterium]|jgi:ribonuclease Z|nr:ribonuclease Z [Flavobacteriaceae bacterium]|tara:strand:- start:6136 stop:7041 length:906 start_codon:yes stop_codon:yes gene_type:complete
MKLTILGCFSASPSKNHFPSAQILEIGGTNVLIDCGEGTQIQLRRCGIKFNSIEHIFISHLHGDHFFGLPGLISTFRLLGRIKPLKIYGPIGIKKAIILMLKLGDSWTNYDLRFIELESLDPVLLLESERFSVKTIPLNHRIYTNGFLFKEIKNERKLLINKLLKLGIDKTQFSGIKKGNDGINAVGEIIKNIELTESKPKDISYAYCSDTCFNPIIIDLIKKCNVLYHESTFLDSHKDLAEKTKHSTAKQAAEIAKLAKVEKLILGHFSSRYKNLNSFQNQAKEIFDNVELASDGKVFNF